MVKKNLEKVHRELNRKLDKIMKQQVKEYNDFKVKVSEHSTSIRLIDEFCEEQHRNTKAIAKAILELNRDAFLRRANKKTMEKIARGKQWKR